MQIGIVDYGASNIFSVLRAISFLGAKAKIVANPEELKSIDKIILPGQGSMGSCINNLKKNDLFESLKKALSEKPYLGICLGLQVLFSLSEESPRDKGLNIFPEKVERLTKKGNLKIPHMGWNQVEFSQSHFMWEGLESSKNFYFVHSYASKEIDEEYIYSKTFNGESFNSAVAKDNIFATQFHPEKSGKSGLNLLQNFIDWKI